MPEWLWWVLGGLGIIVGLYLVVCMVILAFAGTTIAKASRTCWDIFDDE